MDEVTVEWRAGETPDAGRIAVVRFDRGHRANPLALSTMRALTEAARGFEGDARLAAVVLTGRAENFCLGFDLKDAETAALLDLSLAERREVLRTGRRMCRAWAEIEALTISVISGWCVGGGLALAAATDLRVSTLKSNFYAPEIERGMNMSWGSIPRIVDLVGPSKAKRLLILAERIDAERAAAWGLLDEIAENPMEAALAMAARAAAMPAAPARMIKRGIDAYASALAESASHADSDQFALAQTGPDYAEGVASFIEGRPPRFPG
ncbi:enoyl-CoA hydratase/isomerase family protein [Pikeienuella piscinae]|uniref:Enoyl-CoA hydratase/isomerase family protein n=1 Tax=Pikeienuella piscinae TaxID=2748098 RepID=A0A7L5BTI4_9RHOB|nr:enoyl-CoA hydratase/isomerase family protein [Pikeienuella piscinae]QIE54073.1 enoyl-CoA hydratase/isomerase family protein [Pikeienuella piscinae]